MPEDTYFQDMASKRRKILKILLICAAVLTVIVWITIAVFGSIMKPSKARECQAVLQKIGPELKIYAGKNESFPATLDIPELQNLSELKCPSSEEISGYVYLGNIPKNPKPETIIMFDEPGNHTYGRNVLFADGGVMWCTEQIFTFHITRMIEAPYRDYYSEEALRILEDIAKTDFQEGGSAIRNFSMAILGLSLLTAMFWIATFIMLLRYLQVAKYRSQKTEHS